LPTRRRSGYPGADAERRQNTGNSTSRKPGRQSERSAKITLSRFNAIRVAVIHLGIEVDDALAIAEQVDV
jgi:hypothetical protein